MSEIAKGTGDKFVPINNKSTLTKIQTCKVNVNSVQQQLLLWHATINTNITLTTHGISCGPFMTCWLAAFAHTRHRRAYNRKYHADVSAIASGLYLFFFEKKKKQRDNELGEGVSQLWTGMAWRGRRCRLSGSHRATAVLGPGDSVWTAATDDHGILALVVRRICSDQAVCQTWLLVER